MFKQSTICANPSIYDEHGMVSLHLVDRWHDYTGYSEGQSYRYRRCVADYSADGSSWAPHVKAIFVDELHGSLQGLDDYTVRTTISKHHIEREMNETFGFPMLYAYILGDEGRFVWVNDEGQEVSSETPLVPKICVCEYFDSSDFE